MSNADQIEFMRLVIATLAVISILEAAVLVFLAMTLARRTPKIVLREAASFPVKQRTWGGSYFGGDPR